MPRPVATASCCGDLLLLVLSLTSASDVEKLEPKLSLPSHVQFTCAEHAYIEGVRQPGARAMNGQLHFLEDM